MRLVAVVLEPLCVSADGLCVVDEAYMDADVDGDWEDGDDEDEEKETVERTTSATANRSVVCARGF